MSIAANLTSGPFTGTGSQTAFPFTFTVAASGELRVQVDGADISSSLYTVALNADGTGTVNFSVAPANGASVLLISEPDWAQETQLESEGEYTLATINAINRRDGVRSNWLARAIAKILPSGWETVANRAGKFLAWDASGNPIASTGTGADAGLRTDIANSTGAGLTGFSHAQTFSAGTVGGHLKAFVVASDAPWLVKGDDSTDNAAGLNAALAYCHSLGGGDVLLPGGRIRHSATIDNKYPRVRLVGRGFDYVHDSGTVAATRTALVPTFAGTALKIRTPYAAEQGVAAASTQKYWGAGAVGFTIDCGGVATKACEIDSVGGIEVELFGTGCVGTTCFEVKCGVSGTNLGEACDVQHSRIWLAARLVDTVLEKACHIVTFTGSSNANCSLNRGPLNGIFVGGQHWDGHAIYGGSADNNDICLAAYRLGGSGRPVYAKGPTAAVPVGFDANCIRYLASTGTAHAEGTDTAGVTAGIVNTIEHLDRSNGTPQPTYGTGSRWDVHDNFGINTGFAFNKAVLSDAEGTVKSQRLLLGSETLRLHNASAAHAVLTDGTNSWGINVNGTELRIMGAGGTTTQINLGNGVNTKMWQVGFQGSAPIAKPTVTGSRGANAALASLLTALASYGLITDSTS